MNEALFMKLTFAQLVKMSFAFKEPKSLITEVWEKYKIRKISVLNGED